MCLTSGLTEGLSAIEESSAYKPVSYIGTLTDINNCQLKCSHRKKTVSITSVTVILTIKDGHNCLERASGFPESPSQVTLGRASDNECDTMSVILRSPCTLPLVCSLSALTVQFQNKLIFPTSVEAARIVSCSNL